MFRLSALVFAAVSGVVYAQSSGSTTRYWDCCKESCGWPGKANVSAPVQSCDINNNPLSNNDVQSGCNGGNAFACANHSPFAVSDSLSYGFAAANIQGGSESSWCCQCYNLTFTSGSVAGKSLIVQVTNTGGNLDNNQFNLMIPGGGVGTNGQGCASQYGAPATGWGAQDGGVSSQSQCSSLPAALQAGCNWRFDWFQNADDPTVTFQQVSCPSQLTNITKCVRE